MSSKWTVKQSLFCLIGSTCLTFVVSACGLLGYRHWNTKRMTDEACRIIAIVQTGPEKEALKTAYLAELLNLSVDKPTQLYALNLKKAEERLLASPLIASVELKRIPPGTLYIDYTVRKPIAWLADYNNTALDAGGYLFPAAPFFTPKQLPEIYLVFLPLEARRMTWGAKGGSGSSLW